jgi:hypothetical protein
LGAPLRRRFAPGDASQFLAVVVQKPAHALGVALRQFAQPPADGFWTNHSRSSASRVAQPGIRSGSRFSSVQGRVNCAQAHYYLLDPFQFGETFSFFNNERKDKIHEDVVKFNVVKLDRHPTNFDPYPTVAHLDEPQFEDEISLAAARRFLLFANSHRLPSDAFVSVYQRGKWYYILDSDVISKRTLGLIAWLYRARLRHYRAQSQSAHGRSPILRGTLFAASLR